jgi:ABC transporter substrate binding protein
VDRVERRFDLRSGLVVSLAAKYHLPAIYAFAYFPTSGGLVSYGIDPFDSFRRAPAYVDAILRGTKPQDLPVQFPTKFELVINLKTAKTLGLDVPQALLAIADRVDRMNFPCTLETFRDVRSSVANRGKADVAPTSHFGSD